MRKIVLMIITLAVIFVEILHGKSFANTVAYVVGSDGVVLKLDVASNVAVRMNGKIASNIYYEKGKEGSIGIIRNLLLIITAERRERTLHIYDVNTLMHKKSFSLKEKNVFPQIVMLSSGDVFYVREFSADCNCDVLTSINIASLEVVSQKPLPVSGDKLMLSNDNSKLYVIKESPSEAVDIFQFPALTYQLTVTLLPFIGEGAFASGIADYRDNKIVLARNEKSSQFERDCFTLSVYDLENNAISQMIHTNLSGESRLISKGKRILLNETVVFPQKSQLIKYNIGLGRLHIYDVIDGREIMVLNYPVADNIDTNVAAITPAEDKIYLAVSEEGKNKPKLLILDIKSNTIISTIELTTTDIRVVFFEE